MEQILYEELGPIAIITFNREEKFNAMNTAIVKRLIQLFHEVDEADHIRVVVLTGKGKAFVAGADIREYSEQNLAQFTDYQLLSRKMYEGIEKNRKPFIAAVNGYALGGGFEIVLSCDLVVASTKAKMGLPEIDLGLLPGGGGTQKLARIVGRNIAKEFLMTGRRMNAEEGKSLGIVSLITEPEQLMGEALTLAEQIADKSSIAIREAKRLVNQGIESNLDISLSFEQSTLSYLFQTEDSKEGIQAFNQKRRPNFNKNQKKGMILGEKEISDFL